MNSEKELEVRNVICHNGMGGCYNHCGLNIYVDKHSGKIVKTEGNPNHLASHGRMCDDRAIVENWPAKWLYHPGQLLHPLKRVGKRGEGKWEQISYDRALEEIAAKMNKTVTDYGPESIAFMEGTYRSEIGFLCRARFCNALGNPQNVGDPGTICHHAPEFAIECTMTGGGAQFVSDPIDSRLAVVDGGNPPESTLTWWWSFMANRSNIKLICIDPRFTETAREADLWLKIRPGTDGALFIAWIKLLIDEGTFDNEFVMKWTNAPFLVRTDVKMLLRESDVKKDGMRENFLVWDEASEAMTVWKSRLHDYDRSDVKPALEGKREVTLTDGRKVECKTVWTMLREKIESYTPEYVEKITWIPKEKIIETGRLWWTHRPGGFVKGVSSCQWGPAGSGCAMAAVVLLLITGNYDVPGGNPMLIYEPGPMINGKLWLRDSMLELQEKIKPGVKEKQIGADKYKVHTWPGYDMCNKHYTRVWGLLKNFCGHPYLTPQPLLPKAVLEEKPYPIKAMITWSANPMCCAPNTKRTYEMLKSPKLELHVVLEHWMTPTAELADYVIPTASKLERPYVGGHQDIIPTLWVGERAVHPLGERRTEYDFFKGLAEKMGIGWAFPWRNFDELCEERLKPLGLTVKEAAGAKGGVINTDFGPPHKYGSWKEKDPKTNKPRGFLTESGRAEIWSSMLEELGYTEPPYDPLPYYQEPPESPVSTPLLAKEYPLILTTGGRFRPMFHSENRQWGMGFREQHPDPLCDIHHETARRLGIREGDWVWIETRRGRILQKAKVGPQQHPRVVNCEHSWWYPELPGEEPWLHGVWISNTNVLTPDDEEMLDPYCGGWPLRALLCKVYKATPEELQKTPIMKTP